MNQACTDSSLFGPILSTVSSLRPALSRTHLVVLGSVAALVGALFGFWWWRSRQPIHRLRGPNLVFWAWERPEDLRFLDPQKEAVGFLAATVELLPDRVKIYPRMQPLLLASGTQLMAVVRIYSHPGLPASLDAAQLNQTLDALLAATHQPQVTALQIDFDARSSERAFYSQLLAELRSRLGSAYPISITALASWCIGDRWIHNLPVDEAVPMLFSMGNEQIVISHYLSWHPFFPEPLCRGSVGLSTGEWLPSQVRHQTRVYVFSRDAWTQQSVNTIRSRLSGKF